MSENLIVGPISKGLKNDVLPFNVDNDSFPQLINAYQWRSRVKRKRGTQLLNRLTRQIDNATIQTDGSGNFSGNLISLLGLESTSSIMLNSIIIGTDRFVDTNPPTGILTGTTIGTGTINLATGQLTIVGGPPSTIIQFQYFPSLPVMGIEDLALIPTEFPGTIAFDTVYSYNVESAFPFPTSDVSFYKNPAVDAINLPGYVPKTALTPTSWNGNDYQQFWSTNYQGAFWATNGIAVPFDPSIVGMQFKPIVTVTVTSVGPPAIVNLQITGHGLEIGDFVFINEVVTTTGINFQTGYVIGPPVDANNVTVEFPFATITGNGTVGIAQYLTNRANPAIDSLRWYDGDPNNTSNGWVNFSPVLSEGFYSIANLPPAIYYLVGARMIFPFKDRLLFIGPVVQSSSISPKYLQDTVIYNQNGTAFYTASYTNEPSPTVDTPTNPNIVFHSILVPDSQTATSTAYFEDQTGFGGFVSAAVDQPLLTVSANEDTLIMGFYSLQTRFVYSGDDILPFAFFTVNSELGSGSTFSAVNMDQGVITRGSRGYIITNQTSSERIDLEIPDEVFEISLTNNGNERFCAQRDFIAEWIYFTYPTDMESNELSPFPNQTLQYNYRDRSWAIFNECYTTYGSFRKQDGFTWATVGSIYPTWADWNEPWGSGVSNLLQPLVIGGTPQGFLMTRNVGTGEGTSIAIQGISGNIVTSPDHCLNEGDFIQITGVIGTIGYEVNSFIFRAFMITQNTFMLDPNIVGTGTYLGGGLITRLYKPFIQTKQFPAAWGLARKTRLASQQYLLSATDNSQIQLLIYLSQNQTTPYNTGLIYPDPNSINNSLIYSTILFTCPESTNLGLTPANINLQMVTAAQQSQIWHRINISLLGDTIQLGFTISDAQMRMLVASDNPTVITGATNANPCILTCDAEFATGDLIKISGVMGMTQLNGNIYNVIMSDDTTVTIGVDSTGFDIYISGGQATPVDYNNPTAEVELHGFILDISPSMLLA
jgi:hypothetical protein